MQLARDIYQLGVERLRLWRRVRDRRGEKRGREEREGGKEREKKSKAEM